MHKKREWNGIFFLSAGDAMNYYGDTRPSSFTETRMRSLVKALVYRIISLTGTTLISWFVTRDVKETLTLTLGIQIFLIILYYASERVWNRIHWGKQIINN